jgi:hypothetical protein
VFSGPGNTASLLCGVLSVSGDGRLKNGGIKPRERKYCQLLFSSGTFNGIAGNPGRCLPPFDPVETSTFQLAPQPSCSAWACQPVKPDAFLFAPRHCFWASADQSSEARLPVFTDRSRRLVTAFRSPTAVTPISGRPHGGVKAPGLPLQRPAEASSDPFGYQLATPRGFSPRPGGSSPATRRQMPDPAVSIRPRPIAPLQDFRPSGS